MNSMQNAKPMRQRLVCYAAHLSIITMITSDTCERVFTEMTDF